MDRLFCAAVNDTISSSANVSNPYVQTGARRFRRQALPPSKFRETPANFNRRGKMRAKFSSNRPVKPTNYRLASNEGKQRIAVLFAMRHYAQKVRAFIAALRGGKIPSPRHRHSWRQNRHMRFGKITKSNLSVCKIGSNLPIALTLGDLPHRIYAVANRHTG